MTQSPEQSDYLGFLNALSGLIDDAQMSGFGEYGTELLVEAQAAFLNDFADLFPEYRSN